MRREHTTHILLRLLSGDLLQNSQVLFSIDQHECLPEQAQIAQDQMREQELHADTKRLKDAIERAQTKMSRD